ncbi:MAG: hypothetical protein J6A83_02155 [Clostridia bacterium]|nr:hypothetical protein [Clostridia bacterium]
MKIRLLILFLVAVLLSSGFAGCDVGGDTDASLEITEESTQAKPSAVLALSEDMGQEYIDSLIFVGESTTYHLKSRGVLTGGTDTKQVWAPRSGTLNLDMSTKNARIVYPPTGEQLSFSEAAAKSRPKYVVFTFGLNGAVQNIRRGKDYYKRCYLSLISEVTSASPDTKIILQSAFPVASNMDMSNYSVDTVTLNEYIDTINRWTAELAEEEGFRYLDSAHSLKDESGFLRGEFQVGDGHHLTAEAYREILYYIRTHGYK